MCGVIADPIHTGGFGVADVGYVVNVAFVEFVRARRVGF